MLRFWEGKFSQLRPMKRGGGRRYYRPEDVDLLRGIRWLLYSDGYTIKGVQRILRDNGVRFVKECWRDDMPGEAAQAGSGLPEIPNLAGEAATEARKGHPLTGRHAPQGENAGPAAGVRHDALQNGEGGSLSSVVRELEECRDMLRATLTGGPDSGHSA